MKKSIIVLIAIVLLAMIIAASIVIGRDGGNPTTNPTTSNQQGNDPTNPMDPTEPATQPTVPTQPSTQPTDPTKPTEPATSPTEPATKPTDPTKPNDNPTDPTEPTEPSIGPSTEPTNPSAPTEPTTPATNPTTPEESLPLAFLIDGHEFVFGTKLSSLLQYFTMGPNADVWDYVKIEAEESRVVNIYDNGGGSIAELYIYNPSDAEMSVYDCVVLAVSMMNEDINRFAFSIPHAFVDSIKMDKLVEALGESDMEGSYSKLDVYTWFLNDLDEYALVTISVSFNSENSDVEIVSISCQ